MQLEKRLSVLERRVLPTVSADDVLAYVLGSGGLLGADFDQMVRRMPDTELAAAIDALKAQLCGGPQCD